MTHPNSLETTQTSPIEVIHFPNTDAIINHDAKAVPYAHKLAELFSEGAIPETWKGPSSLRAQGEIDGKSFFAKVKKASGRRNYRELVELRHEQATDQDLSLKGLQTTLAVLRAGNSVFHEIKMSNHIKTLMSDDAAQTIAHNHGFNSVRLAEPILGVTDKQSGKKIMIYENVDGEDYRDPRGQTPSEDETRSTLSDQFRSFFSDNGIEANDLEDRQFMVDRDNNLVLLDIEQYRHMPQPVEAIES